MQEAIIFIYATCRHGGRKYEKGIRGIQTDENVGNGGDEES